MFERELIIQAPAKLNLYLKVVAKRSDGFHEIDTVMQAIDLQDTLIFKPLPTSEIRFTLSQIAPQNRCTGELRDQIPANEENLVVKAARLIQQSADYKGGVDITLIKRIPSQAGLGGGSSDAGITLRGLNQLWNLQRDNQSLSQLAARLGSDIPFFATAASTARCLGRGEELSTASGRPLHFVIVKPPAGLSTAKVYANCTASTFHHSGKDLLNALRTGSLSELKLIMKNGLEDSARSLSPAVHELLTVMQDQPFVCSLLSGSGSACFGLCRSRSQALSLAGRLKAMTSGEVFVARSRV